MKLFLLATVAVVHGQVLIGTQDITEQATNLINKQLSGNEKDCAINAINAIKSGMGISDTYDQVVSKCGFTLDQLNSWTTKLDNIQASITGEKAAPHNWLSDSQTAELTGIEQAELDAEKQRAAASIAAVVGPTTAQLPPVASPVASSNPAPTTGAGNGGHGLFNIQLDHSAAQHGLFTMQ